MWFLPRRHTGFRPPWRPTREDADLQRAGGSRIEEWDQGVLVRILSVLNARSFISSHYQREWPTVPQLYVNSEFVGGCDIVLGSESRADLLFVYKPTAC